MLIHGDCLEKMKVLPNDSVDLVLTDPPYGNLVNCDWDKWNVTDYVDFTRLWLTECKRVMKPEASIYVWCSIGNKSDSLLTIAAELKRLFVFQDMIVWAKQRGRGNRRGWLFTREEILWATKTENYCWNKDFQYSDEKYTDEWIKRLGREENPYKRLKNVWTDVEEPTIEMVKQSGGKGSRKLFHPTQKPLKAMKRIILSHTKEGDVVLDPFAGSGTTGIACAETGREYVLIEKDDGYYKILEERCLPKQ